MRVTPLFALFVVAVAVLTMDACGGGSSAVSTPPPAAPTVISVAVSPDASTLVINASQQFAATVIGTGNGFHGVSWFVNGVQGGTSTTGTVTSTGLYTAPQIIPTPSIVTVTAKSDLDASKFGSASVTVVPENVQVSINPGSASVQLGAGQQFDVTVTGTVNTGVTWTINGFQTNPDFGSFVYSGFYIAPTLLPANPIVTLTATSNQDPTKSASALVNILATAGGINVSITPTNPDVPIGDTTSVQFKAAVTGTSNTTVTWTLGRADSNQGVISQDGLYTPAGISCGDQIPQVTVHAISTANGGAQAATPVNFVAPATEITGVSPQPAAAGTDLQIAGTIPPGAKITLFYPAPHGQTIASGTTVPLGSTSGPFDIAVQCGEFPVQHSHGLEFQRQPRLRIRVDHKDLSAGEAVQLRGVMLGDDAPQTIAWGNGISSDGIYTAPSQVAADTFITLSGCIQNTAVCDSLIVRVNPVAIGPTAPTVPMGETLQLSATSGGGIVSPAWSILAGGGDLGVDGTFTAPLTLADSGPVSIQGSYSGFDAKASIAVTGAYPGLVNRVNDYLDPSDPVSLGTVPSSLAVDSSHAYVLAVYNTSNDSEPKECSIDAYDISDPVHPVWLDAAETVNLDPFRSGCYGALYTYGGTLYEAVRVSGRGITEIVAYSLVNNHLQLERIWQVLVPSVYFNEGVFYGLSGGDNSNRDSIAAFTFDVRNGDLIQTNLNLPLPQPGVTAQFSSPAGAGNFVYLFAIQPGGGTGTVVLCKYDISTSPPTLVNTVDAFVGLPSQGVLLNLVPVAIFGNYLYDSWDVFDISGELPIRTGTIPYSVEAVNPATSLALSGASIVTVTDVSDSANAVVVSVLDDVAGSPGGTPVWVGNMFYQTAGSNGWGIWDVSGSGGQIPRTALADSGVFGIIFGQVVGGSSLYTAEQTDVGPLVNIYDLSGTDPVLSGSYSENGQDPLSVALLGTSLFVGTQEGLLVLDVSNPAHPSKIASLALPTCAVATSGHYLFSGTTDNHLVVFDVTDPQSPQEVGNASLPSFPVNLRTVGSLLLIADNSAGLLMYDISTPSAPTLLSRYKPRHSSATVDVAMDGNFAFLAAAEGGLVILDLTNPSAPALLSQTDLSLLGGPGAAALSIGINHGIAYVGAVNTLYGVAFGFDYKVPAHPRLVSAMSYGGALDEAPLDFAFYQSQMFVGGNLFAVADRRSDITQPRNVINLYYPGLAGGSGSLNDAKSRRMAIHPKLKETKIGTGKRAIHLLRRPPSRRR